MMRRFACVVAIVLSAVALSGQSRASNALATHTIDVEGGNATLFVSPTGESPLIDTGNAGAGAVRDATRIVEAARHAVCRKSITWSSRTGTGRDAAGVVAEVN